MSAFSRRVILFCFLRSISIGAVASARGQQNLGFLHALEPALAYLYKNKDALASARKRHMGYVLTHPHMAPLLVGVLLNLEALTARGGFTAEAMGNLKETMATTLSAVGDSFFSGSLIPFWAISSGLAIMYDRPGWGLAFTVLLLLAIMAFRVGTFFLGLRQGLLALRFVRYIDLINWGDRLKVINGFMLAALLFKLSIPDALPLQLGGAVFAFAAPAVLAPLAYKSRYIRLLLFMAVVALFHFIVLMGWDFIKV